MNKISKKMISLLLGFVVLFTTIMNPSQFVAKAGETEGYKIAYNPQQMTESNDNYPFMYNGTNCATQRYEMVVSEGHTNILSYKPTHDGTIYFGGGADNTLSSWGAMNITVKENSDSSRKIEFCIADNEGNILYPTNKDVITINDGDTHTYSDIAIPVTKDKEINFVFHGVTGITNSIDFTGYMQFISTDGSVTYNNVAWRMYPENDPATQGADGFYFKYSATYEKKSLNEPEETPYNKLQFTSQQMTESYGDYLFSYDEGKCGIYQSDLRVSAGYATIVTYKAPANGTVYFSNNTISSWSQMQLTLTGNTTGANKVDFCIADNEGNILYPSDGKHEYGFDYYLTEGVHTVTLEYIDEPIFITKIFLCGEEGLLSYKEVLAQYKAEGKTKQGGKVEFEAEDFERILYTTDSVIGLQTNGDPCTSPRSLYNIKMNYIGGWNYRSGNQEITWKFDIKEGSDKKDYFRWRQYLSDR